MTRNIETYCDETENAILAARATGDDARADRLRERFTRAAGLALPAIGCAAPPAGPNVSSAGH